MIIILINLFTGKDNKIVMTNNLYVFFFLIYNLLLMTPIRFFEKSINSDCKPNNYMYKIKEKDVQKIRKHFNQLTGCVNNLVNELLDIFFKAGSETYDRDDFKKKLLDETNNFMFSNICLKSKIEEKMKEKELD